MEDSMVRLLSTALFCLTVTVGVCSATILTTVPGPACVGENTASCPGSIEVFSGDPGVFLAGSVARIREIGGPYNAPSAGTVASAVFRDPSGKLAFYYQAVLNETSAPLERITVSNCCSFPEVFFSFNGGDFGIRTDGIGAFDPVTFVPSAREPTSILLRNGFIGQPIPFLSTGFADLQPGEASATWVVLSDAQYWSFAGFSSVLTAPGPDVGRYLFSAVGDMLVPANVPEPATWGIVGFGILMAGLTLRRFGHREK